MVTIIRTSFTFLFANVRAHTINTFKLIVLLRAILNAQRTHTLRSDFYIFLLLCYRFRSVAVAVAVATVAAIVAVAVMVADKRKSHARQRCRLLALTGWLAG